MNLLVEIVVAMIIACSVKMCVVPLRAVTTITHLCGSRLPKGKMKLLSAKRDAGEHAYPFSF
jgi:hypothetical protein